MKGSYNTFVILGVVFLLSACVPFKRIESQSDVHAKLGGNWVVIHDGHKKVEGLTPAAFISFNEDDNKLSGFDGCNRFNGSYQMENGILKSTVRSTKKVCTGPIANDVSNIMQLLLKDGAEVVSIEFMGAKALLLRNKSDDVELRFGNAEQLNTK
ncbi:META domain-containing protein [Aeromonas veronii]|uniref:META domain-containing protein n=1 Tax=Aeromonas veronii TaxID=654 RepID=UPI00214D4CC4|nr:META domain-containing protein [Aeromonas veronii]MCR3970912.1 META domain-containing protein [Aeromonas veronii]MCR3975240.1 META domain-containing protein [Aeromonas veronii]